MATNDLFIIQFKLELNFPRCLRQTLAKRDPSTTQCIATLSPYPSSISTFHNAIQDPPFPA